MRFEAEVYTSFKSHKNCLDFSREAAMISKCANPLCDARFLYLHEGKLFRFERECQDAGEVLLGIDPKLLKPSSRVEFFWLCGKCSAWMTLIHCKGVGVTTHPVHRLLKQAS